MASSRLVNLHAPPLPRDVAELTSAIAELPADQRARLEPICQRVADSTRRRQRILSLVQEALGHSSINITLDTYSHLMPNIQREAADKLNDLINA